MDHSPGHASVRRRNIVGFALDDPELVGTMQGWAASGNGSYFDATGAASLAEAITRAVDAPFRVLDPNEAIIAGGTVGGDPVPLDPGTYRVEVLTDPPASFEDVVVPAGTSVSLELPSDESGG